jgi:hypothetical protein
MLYILPSSESFVKDRVRLVERFIPVILVLRGSNVLTDALRKGVEPSGPRRASPYPLSTGGGSRPPTLSILPSCRAMTTQLHNYYTTATQQHISTPPLHHLSTTIHLRAYQPSCLLDIQHNLCSTTTHTHPYPPIRTHMTYTTTHPLHISTHTCLPAPSLPPTITHLYTTTHTPTHDPYPIPPPAHRRGV